MAEKGIINGVDVDRFYETVDAITEKPEIAKFTFRAKNQWIKGGHNRTTIDEFYGAGETHKHSRSFVLDKGEPPVLLGEDEGANPVEYLLAALAGCLTSSLIYHAAARGIHIDAVESTLEGDLDGRGFMGLSDEVRNGYEGIKVHFSIKSDASEEQLKELVELAQNRSPVFDIVTNRTPVSVDFEKSLGVAQERAA